MNDSDSLFWTPSAQDLEIEKRWIADETARIGMETLSALALKAADMRNVAYVPYSKYHVGVALLSASGHVSLGANAERASYSETDHAEESAVTAAILSGEIAKSGRKFIRAVVVSDAAPCGRCRQIITEHADNALIVITHPDGNIHRITSLKCLLPYSFGPSDLGII